MQGSTRTRPAPPAPAQVHAHAVVWIGARRAVVLRGTAGEHPAPREIPLPAVPARRPPALARVARAIGAVDRVLVLGPDDERTALERELVAIGHRPETIAEAVFEAVPRPEDLRARLRGLAAAGPRP